MPRFSIIIPVYNRPGEIADLLESLAAQTVKNFEVVITEDGSTIPCRDICDRYADRLDITYLQQENIGRSPARNNSMEHARGDYFVFFDSDCVIPADYFATLADALDEHSLDCFGGPDAAHESFTDTQKAINFAMTSFLTTGGIRGGKASMEKFTPRTFNMGFSRRVYEKVGGFREMFSEDIDMSKRIEAAGFTTGLIRRCPVFHKRRIDFGKFFRQVHVFGKSRITLKLLYPGSMKLVHALPACFVVGLLMLVIGAILLTPWLLVPIGVYVVALFAAALASTRSLKVALMAVPAAFIQLIGYGTGFIKAFFTKIILGKGRNIEEEIAARKGK